MTTSSPAAGSEPVPPAQARLRTRIGWLCHLIRIAAVLWALWTLGMILWGWYRSGPDDVAKIAINIGRFLNADLVGLSNAQVVAVFAGSLGLWAFMAAIVYCVWRLFGTYLQGRIFTVDAAAWLQRFGSVGIAWVVADIVWRPLILVILTRHAPVPLATVLWSGPPLIPFDLLRAGFFLFLIMLGRIFKTAAAMADDQARIV